MVKTRFYESEQETIQDHSEWLSLIDGHKEHVTPQKYPRIFIIILLYILGMNWAKLGFFWENDDLTNYEIANLVNPEI